MERRYKITSCTTAVPCPDIISELKAIAIVEEIEFPLSRLEDLFNSVPVILSDLTPLEALFRQWSKEHPGIAIWMTALDYDAMTDNRLKFTAGTIIYRERPLSAPTRQEQVAVKLAEINSQLEDLECKKTELLQSIRRENSALLPPINPDYHD